ARSRATVPDDRSVIEPGDRVLLIVEDDPAFARQLLELAREHGFRGIVCMDGESALDAARALEPDAISLDLRLPDVDGWVLLDRLKHDSETRHIPVHVISGSHEAQRALEQGALAFLGKPVTRESLGRALEELSTFL